MLEEPKITLVGAGPGGTDLISLRGLKALAKADVVLYDALVDEELLQYAPQAVQRIFVGKRAGVHRYPQTEINRMLVDYARSHGHVVRLKGGDPFVFGRGYEEIEYAHQEGILTEIIPGISSAVAVPALQGIPLTHRGTSESFWVITGTTTSGEISNDIYLAAKTKATVVILMGVNKIKAIADIYKEEEHGNLPVAVIQNGAMPNEKVVLSHIDSLEEDVRKHCVKTPAVIVIGEVVGLHESYKTLKIPNELVDIK